MEERTRDDGFEATFVVSVSRATAWEMLVSAQPVSDTLSSPRAGQWWIPAIEAPADELEVKPEELLRCKKAVEPCRGTEIVITMEDDGSGTRITIVQTGFGAGFAEQRPWLEAGWFAIAADLVVFFERGIALGRHVAMWWDIGCDVLETGEGLVVGTVRAGSFAEQAGLQRADLIMQLAGSPVLNIRDLAVLVRGPLQTGVETQVRYLRGAEIRTGQGVI